MKLLSFLFFLLFIGSCFSQSTNTGTISGIITDDIAKELIVGAKVNINNKYRALSDYDGKYSLKNVPYGKYKMVVSILSFDTLVVYIDLKEPSLNQNLILGGSVELEEVKIIGNVVRGNNVPIAVTTISTKKITEELGSRDLPMLLNGTAGVYATQQGGGDGDARINVRGFDQRNVGVMIDGVPVNDMENGAVYWSNWFGLDAITSTIQVQRGLGATKIAMPSIGGTINIITQGIGSKKGGRFKQEYGTGNFLRSSFSYNTGMTKSGWGLTFSGSYKRGDGWVDGTQTEGFFGYLKLSKRFKNHLFTLSAFAAPQQHGQRSYSQPIQYWSADEALNLGLTIDSSQNYYNQGIQFNQHWGYRTIDGKKEVFNERLNYYTKPQITLKDFWKVNEKLSISNLAYLSIASGGGTRIFNSSSLQRDSIGLIDWDRVIEDNQVNSLFGTPNVDAAYHPTLIKSNNVLLASVNKHFWVGYLGQFNYEFTEKVSFSGGIDYRFYKGEHYQEIKDLLGGDYFVSTANQNSSTAMMVEGDKVAKNAYNAYRDGLVNWIGSFGQMEYTGDKWSTFINVSGIINSYKGIDYFQKRELDLGDTILQIGANDTINYNGEEYTSNSSGLTNVQTDWKTIPGFTFKSGASYAINDNSNVFMNVGYLSRTPQFSNVIDNNTNTFFKEIVNEKILALEGGYNLAGKAFGINLNGYLTNWKNKPFPYGVSVPDPQDPTETIRININGMDAIHIGGEFDLAWKINKIFSTELMFSYGDWFWNSSKTVFIPQYDSLEISFDAKGVHVGDAAQTALSAALRIQPLKQLYFKIQYQFFDRYYANFDPFSLQGENGGRESWMIPSYSMLNLFAGYRYKFKSFVLFCNGNITNMLNNIFITDARNNYNDPFNFDAQSANVMFGQGFRFNVSLGIQF